MGTRGSRESGRFQKGREEQSDSPSLKGDELVTELHRNSVFPKKVYSFGFMARHIRGI
jgi:hypothetical protein